MPRYKKLKEEFRDQLYDARTIFEEAERVVTPEWVAWIKHHWQEPTVERPAVGYAFAIERQSLGKVALGDPNHTGHIARVQQILRLADLHRLYLIPPVERQDRREGDTPYIFDPRIWYVDGEDERSTGFSPSPEVRPRLWALYAVLRQINRIDPSARPNAIIIADEVRFLRADHAIKEWYRAIKHEGVDLIFPESGRVLADHLDMLAMKVRVASTHLQFYCSQSREIARQQGRVPWGKALTGTRWEERGRHLVADPDWWPKLADCVRQLACGAVPSIRAVPAYMLATYGKDYVLTCATFHKLLKKETIFDGYDDAFKTRCEPCLVRERHGPRFDFSFTPGRAKRYVHTSNPEEKWVRKVVEHRHGTTPIDPVVLAEARRRTSIVGRPVRRTDEVIRWQLVPKYMLRCDYCKSSAREHAGLPPELKAGKHGVACEWAVGCELSREYVGANGMTSEQFREMLKRDGREHKRTALGSVSLALIPLLREKLFDPTLVTSASLFDRPQDMHAEQHALETEREQISRRINIQILTLEDLDANEEPATYQAVRVRLRALEQQLKEVDQKLNHLAATTLQQAEYQSSLAMARRDFLGLMAEQGERPEFWGAIIRTFVNMVWVNMEAATFRAEIAIDLPGLKHLEGNLWRGDALQMFTTPTRHGHYQRAWTVTLEGFLIAA